jgi:hypothetical protein
MLAQKHSMWSTLWIFALRSGKEQWMDIAHEEWSQNNTQIAIGDFIDGASNGPVAGADCHRITMPHTNAVCLYS